MQDTTMTDGRVFRELFQATKDEQLKRAAQAIYNPNVVAFSQKAVGRNQPCPCGSGKKFKKCCIGQEWRRLKQAHRDSQMAH